MRKSILSSKVFNMKNILFLFLLLTTIAEGQRVTVDSSFGVNGLVRVNKGPRDQLFGYISAISGERLKIAGRIIRPGEETIFTSEIDIYSDDTISGSGLNEVHHKSGFLEGHTFALTSDQGHIVIAVTSNAQEDLFTSIYKLKADNRPDSTFGVNGSINLGDLFNNIYESITETSQGYVLAGKNLTYDSLKLLRLDKSGRIDSSFGINGKSTIGLDISPLESIGQLGVLLLNDAAGDLYLGASLADEYKSLITVFKFSEDGRLNSNFANAGIYSKLYEGYLWGVNFKSDDESNLYFLYVSQDSSRLESTGFLKLDRNGVIDSKFKLQGSFLNGGSDTSYRCYDLEIYKNYLYMVFPTEYKEKIIAYHMFKATLDGDMEDEHGVYGFYDFTNGLSLTEDYLYLEILNDSTIFMIGDYYEQSKIDLAVRKFKMQNNYRVKVKSVAYKPFSVYPSLVKDRIFIPNDVRLDNDRSAYITDAMGNIVLIFNLSSSKSEVDVARLKPGSYYIVDQERVARFIKR